MMTKFSSTIETEVAPSQARELLTLGAVDSRTLAALAPERRDVLASEASHRRIARVGPEAVGLLLADETEPEKTLRALYVRPEWRRRGIARRIMQALIDWLPGTDVVRLVLHASDEGRPLYEQMGFVPTNEMRYTGQW